MSIKIIDKTPFHDENGHIDIIGQVQARLKYGLSWMSAVKAQEQVIAILDMELDSNYTLLRNTLLPGTEVLLPLVLSGPAGVFLLNITNMRGVYRARGEEWGTVDGVNFKPAPVNLVMRTMRLAAGLQKFLERQGLGAAVHVEGVLMTANPGMIVDSIRPVVRIVMSDAFDRFAASLLQARNTLSPEAAHTIADRLVNPLPPKKVEAPPPPAEAGGTPLYIPEGLNPLDEKAAGRELDADSFGFDSSDRTGEAGSPVSAAGAAPSMPAPRARPASGGFKVTTPQLIVLGCLGLFWICAMIGFIVWILRSQ